MDLAVTEDIGAIDIYRLTLTINPDCHIKKRFNRHLKSFIDAEIEASVELFPTLIPQTVTACVSVH